MKKYSIKSLLENLYEWEDDFEGPQPGDADYHYNPPKPIKGLSQFKHIDWQAMWETLIHNTQVEKDKIKNDISYSVNDFLEGMSKEDINLLENRDIIHIFDGIPIFDNDEYRDYDAFYKAAQEAWMQGFDTSGYNDNSSETPYLRGNEMDEEVIYEVDFGTEDELTDNTGDGTSESSLLSKLEKQSDFVFAEMKDKVQKHFSNIQEAINFINETQVASTEPYNFVFSVEDPNSQYDFIFELKMSFEGQVKNPFYSLKSWTYHTENDGNDNDYTFFGEDSSTSSYEIQDIFQELDFVTKVSNSQEAINESKTPEEKEMIRKNNREKFTDRMMNHVVLNEEQQEDEYENVVFLQDSEATEALKILNIEGTEAALEYLKQWHQPGNHDTHKGDAAGAADKIYRDGNYVMAYNLPLGYIGLSYKIEPDEIAEKAESQAQQKFFGAVKAIQAGDIKPSEASKGAQKAADNMSQKSVDDYANTKQAGLPMKKEEKFLDKFRPSKKLKDIVNIISAWYEENDDDSVERVERFLDKLLGDDNSSSDEKISLLKTKYKKAFYQKPVLEEEFEEEEIQVEKDMPDYENDCFIQSNGWTHKVVCSGKSLSDNIEDFDSALEMVNSWKNKNKFFPNTWYINDHGNETLIDEFGNEIK